MANIDILLHEEPIENPNERAEFYMDYFFKYYSPTELNILESIIEESDLPAEKKREASRLESEIITLLTKTYDYAERVGKYPHPMLLTEAGKKAKSTGGHFAFRKALQEYQTQETEFRKKQFQLTEAQLQEIKDAKTRSLQAEETSRIANRNSRTANVISSLSILITIIIAFATCKH